MKGNLIITIDPGGVDVSRLEDAREKLVERLGPDVKVTFITANGVAFIPDTQGDK